MERMIAFEKCLYGDDDIEPVFDFENLDFCIDRIIKLPSFRPFRFEVAVELCSKYCRKNQVFRQKLLVKAIDYPALIFRLYKKGVFNIEELEPLIDGGRPFLLRFYFRREIKFLGFDYRKTSELPKLDEVFFQNDENIDQMIEYGFLPSSIEYCLKYDDISIFREICIKNRKCVKWSPFEWSIKPVSLDFLSFSGFFGSIKCFKHLLLNGYDINDRVRSSVVCSGSMDLFHLCDGKKINLIDEMLNASRFGRTNIISYFVENGTDINIIDSNY